MFPVTRLVKRFYSLAVDVKRVSAPDRNSEASCSGNAIAHLLLLEVQSAYHATTPAHCRACEARGGVSRKEER